MKHTIKAFQILIVIICSALFMSCGSKAEEVTTVESNHHSEEENTIEFTEAQYKTSEIELAKVENKQISGTIKVNGVLDAPPQQMVSVSVPLGGFLKKLRTLGYVGPVGFQGYNIKGEPRDILARSMAAWRKFTAD